MAVTWEVSSNTKRTLKNIRCTALEAISPESIIRRFKKWCVSEDVNGTENRVLWKEVMKNTLPVKKVMVVAS
jgi:hypothetical protein